MLLSSSRQVPRQHTASDAREAGGGREKGAEYEGREACLLREVGSVERKQGKREEGRKASIRREVELTGEEGRVEGRNA